MTKKKNTGMMVTAKVVGIQRNEDNMGVVFDYAEQRSPFTVYFEVVDDDLDYGDLVTVTIMRSEE